jgi:hypothetical protein
LKKKKEKVLREVLREKIILVPKKIQYLQDRMNFMMKMEFQWKIPKKLLVIINICNNLIHRKVD